MRGMIFDVDGTLVDTNDAHIDAWHRAFAACGYDVPRERILPEVGKGGDMLVPSVIGEANDERDGERLRQLQSDGFLATARRTRFPVFPGGIELLEELRRRRIQTAIATSSRAEHLEATLRSAGIDLRRLVEEVVTASDADASKPAPDVVLAAVRKLRREPDECIMVGDTAHDGEACARAGVPFLGVLCGGKSRETLLAAGAMGVWPTPRDLLENLDAALELAAVPRA
jgi:HAD superfamily hydrolase (TIGR01509 family)